MGLPGLIRPYLSGYVDALQTLRQKVNKSLVDKMISTKVMSHTTGVVCQEGLRLLLKRPWEPAAYQTADPPVLKTLPYDATLILTPNLPAPANPKMRRLVSKRMSNWRKMWGEVFANVFEIEPPNYSSATGPADVKQVGSRVPLCTGNHRGGRG